jgi:hypothetical protein
MNYSPITSRLSYKTNPAMGGITPLNGNLDTPQFEKYEEDNLSSRFKPKPDLARMAMKQEYYAACDSNANESELTRMFFSHENVKRIQKLLKQKIFVESKGAFKLDTDQSLDDLLIAMRGTFLLESRHLPFKIVHQVKELNRKVVDNTYPDMLTSIRQQYDYIKEINRPIVPISRPLNVGHSGRRSAPALTSAFGF